jgi:protease I
VSAAGKALKGLTQMASESSGLRIAFIVSDEGMEQVELTNPRQISALHDTDHVYYGAVVVRGGVTEGDLLRTAWAAVSSMQELNKADEPVAGQRVLVEVDVVRGPTLTSWPPLDRHHNAEVKTVSRL